MSLKYHQMIKMLSLNSNRFHRRVNLKIKKNNQRVSILSKKLNLFLKTLILNQG